MRGSSVILWIKAVIAFAFGLLLLLAPSQVLALFGITPDPSGLMMTQLVGALDIGVGMISGYVRDEAHTPLGEGIVLSLVVQDVIAAIALIVAQAKGVANSWGWLIVIVNIVFALALLYVRFLSSRPMTQAHAPSKP